MCEPTTTYTDEQLAGDAVSKKELVTYLQTHAALQFQSDHKLKGSLKNVSKVKTKDQLVADYKEMFATKAFKAEGEDEAAAVASAAAAEAKAEADTLAEKTKKLDLKEAVPEGPPKYSKKVLKKGDKTNYPRKGDNVACYYTGMLQDGKVFDSNDAKNKKGKKQQPLRFKVGTGKVIRGWDEALKTMSAGEKAEITIEPEWAYGRKGLEGRIPPNSTLIFEVELVGIE